MFTRVLADAGYDCGMIGKQHLSACEHWRTELRHDDGYRVFEWAHSPLNRSRQSAYMNWLRHRSPETYARLFPEQGDPSLRGNDNVVGLDFPIDTVDPALHFSHWVAERAIDFIGTRRANDQPFFLMANFFDPHHPFGAPAKYRELFDAAKLPLPKGYRAPLDTRPAGLRAYAERSQGGQSKGAIDYPEDELRAVIANYYAMVAQVDVEVGRILESLAAAGLAEDTLVIFTSDHGEMLGDHSTLLKGPMMYEGAVRVPLILRWPGRIPEGRTLDDTVQWIDLTSTILDAAAVRTFSGQQGASLLPLIDGQARGRGWAVCEYRNSGAPAQPPIFTTMLRDGDVKLILWHGRPATDWEQDGEIYDLSTDPDELVNLWSSADHADLREHMLDRLADTLCAIEDRSQPRVSNW
jgi:arylsulfatase A-like enzyme